MEEPSPQVPFAEQACQRLCLALHSVINRAVALQEAECLPSCAFLATGQVCRMQTQRSQVQQTL